VSLTQTDLANWVSAIATSAATIVAVGLATWEIRRTAVERRDKEVQQARLVTIEVDSHWHGRDPFEPWVIITNHSDQPVYQPLVSSIRHTTLEIRWCRNLRPSHAPCDPNIEVLPPHKPHRVAFHYFHPDHTLDLDRTKIEGWIEVDDVTIMFTDAAGLRWERTGHKEPVRNLIYRGRPIGRSIPKRYRT
jgi:hypothetical protein